MKNIVVLVSGGGTNLQALIDAEKSEGLGGDVTMPMLPLTARLWLTL